jgi:AraC-like DNA-binding protein
VDSVAEEDRAFHFSTDGVPPRERHRAVRELYDRKIVRVTFEPLTEEPMRVVLSQRRLAGVRILSGTLGGLYQEGASERAAQGSDDDLFLSVNLAGNSTARQSGEELAMHGGDAVLTTRGDVGFSIIRPTQVQFLGLLLSRQTLAPLVTGLDGAVMRFIPCNTPALRLLKSYIAVAAHDSALLDAEVRRLFAIHVCDLTATMIGATRDAAHVADGRGIRAARLLAIKADIAANLSSGELTITTVAARHGVTPRYVQKLFESEGISYSRFVLGLRLASAHRTLIDPRFAHRSISMLAYDSGFGDLSYFNRAFKQRYGATPSEVQRQSALRIVTGESP